MVITKRDLISEAAKLLGDDYTLGDVKEVYSALQAITATHLLQANKYNPVTVKFGNGLSVSSKIKEINHCPRMWLKARITRHYNRVTVNKLPK